VQDDGLCMEKRANLKLGDGALVSADLQRASSVPVGDVGRCDGGANHYTRGNKDQHHARHKTSENSGAHLRANFLPHCSHSSVLP